MNNAEASVAVLEELQRLRKEGLREVYIEDETLTLPSGLELEVLMVAAGLSALVGWMTLTGSILAMFKLKGGIEIRGKWYRTPTWGPSWLNYVKIL